MSGAADTRRYRPTPETVATRMGDEIVLVHTTTDRIYVLNRTGARLWELLATDCDRDEIERRMLDEFEVDEAELVREMDRWLTSLLDDALIQSAP